MMFKLSYLHLSVIECMQSIEGMFMNKETGFLI